MSNRPQRRNCKSVFRRDSEERRKSGRDALVNSLRNVNDALKAPPNTVFVPIVVMPNPKDKHTDSSAIRRISVSPLGLPSTIPPPLRTNWDPSQVVNRDNTTQSPSPLLNFDILDESASDINQNEQESETCPGLVPDVDSDNAANIAVVEEEIVDQIDSNLSTSNSTQGVNPSSVNLVPCSTNVIMDVPCGNGLRKDCFQRETCTLRHIWLFMLSA